jgi:hypothetical protein
MPRSYTGLAYEQALQEQQGGLLPGQRIGMVVSQAPGSVEGGIYDPFTGEVAKVPLQLMNSGGDGGMRIMVLNTDIDRMTWGAENTFSLMRGRRYLVPSDLYDWLESKGLVG